MSTPDLRPFPHDGPGAGPTAVIAGIGTCLPVREISNAALLTELDTSDEWIRSRTGIAARRIAESGVSMRDLAVAAGDGALRSAGRRTVDALVLATSTPDRLVPAAAPEIAERLGQDRIPAFDVSAVCSGFVYALATATGLITAGIADSVLVVASEVYSRIVNPRDRDTAVLFGDGAGAVVLRRGGADEQGSLLSFDLGSDGAGSELIRVPEEAEQPEGPRWFAMAGRKVYLRAIDHMTASALHVLKDCAWTAESVGAFVPHQANARITQAVAERLGLPPGRALSTLERVGNTAAASIPLALAEAQRTGRLRPGDRTVLTAFGAGLTWGSAGLVWPEVTAVHTEL